MDRAGSRCGKILQRRKEGVSGRRAKLEKALINLKKPIIVVLDDIDRLSTAEIRDVFKLVRLTASFPNIVYIVAFDRVRVEEALAEDRVPGRDYLEKILQVTVDLPAIPSQVLNHQVFSAVEHAIANIDKPGPFDEQVWSDVFMDIIRPLIRNMRDVRRYAAAIQGTIGVLEGRVALADVLALEAVRVFLPNVFIRLHGAIDGLTNAPDLSRGFRNDAEKKAQIDGLIEAAEKHPEVVRNMIRRLFTASQHHIGGSHHGDNFRNRWRRERRVAHEDFLRFYLERVAGEGLEAFTDAEKAWARMSDRDAFDGYLRSLDPERLQDVISSLEAYEDQFAPEHVVPGTIVLLNLLSDIPGRPRGLFDFGTRLTVTRVTYRLLRSLDAADRVEAAVRSILPELDTLSAQLEVISTVGHRERRGSKLVSEDAAAEAERVWRNDVRARSVDHLVKESNLVRVLLTARREADPAEPTLEIPGAAQLTLAILRDARSEVIAHTSRAVRRSPQLDWGALIEIYGDQDALKERIEHAKAAGVNDVDNLFELADKYLSGWSPNELDDT